MKIQICLEQVFYWRKSSAAARKRRTQYGLEPGFSEGGRMVENGDLALLNKPQRSDAEDMIAQFI